MSTIQCEARRRFAALTRQPQKRWAVVPKPEPGHWYDFYCPETDRWGQCMRRADGTWAQEPMGTRPVILRYLGRKASKARA